MYNYSVLLSYVNRSNFNVLKVQDTNGRDLSIANTTREKPLVEQEFDTDVPPPFNSYSGVGQAKVNIMQTKLWIYDLYKYCQVDFDELHLSLPSSSFYLPPIPSSLSFF